MLINALKTVCQISIGKVAFLFFEQKKVNAHQKLILLFMITLVLRPLNWLNTLLHWKLFPHPTYGPDLSQYSFCLFGFLNDALEDIRFKAYFLSTDKTKTRVKENKLQVFTHFLKTFVFCVDRWRNLQLNRGLQGAAELLKNRKPFSNFQLIL